MKNHFYTPYSGNKRNEVKLIYDSINFDNIDTIIEPYCGSCAFSYYVSIQDKTKKYKYILNDNNPFLKEMYEIIKDDKKSLHFENEYERIVESFTDNREEYNKIVKTKNNILSWVIANKIYTIRPGNYPYNKPYKKTIKLSSYPIYDFFKNEDIEFNIGCGVQCYEKYKDNDNCLLFLDPPYLNSCNDFYLKSNTNIYEYLFTNNINNEIANIVLCLENIWMIKLLFQNNLIKHEYGKTYQTAHRKTMHVIILNK